MSDIQSTSQAEGSTALTLTLSSDETDQSQDVSTVRLKLKKPKSRKKVNWTEETIDNENMGKKKSKCCCIYQKPRALDESSSEEDIDECDHCHGHVELKKKEPSQTPAPDTPPSMITA